MTQVLRMQLIHMQTRSDTYTHVQRESCGEEREAVSDGEGEEGHMWESQRGLAYYQFNLHSYWLPRDCYYGEIRGNPNVLSSAGILLVLITDLLPRSTYSHYLMGKKQYYVFIKYKTLLSAQLQYQEIYLISMLWWRQLNYWPKSPSAETKH